MWILVSLVLSVIASAAYMWHTNSINKRFNLKWSDGETKELIILSLVGLIPLINVVMIVAIGIITGKPLYDRFVRVITNFINKHIIKES